MCRYEKKRIDKTYRLSSVSKYALSIVTVAAMVALITTSHVKRREVGDVHFGRRVLPWHSLAFLGTNLNPSAGLKPHAKFLQTGANTVAVIRNHQG